MNSVPEWTNDRFGPRATVSVDAWSDALAAELEERGVRELELAPGHSTGRRDLGFLRQIPFIEKLSIHSVSALDDSAVACLFRARELELHNYAPNPLRVDGMSRLEKLTFVWRQHSESVFSRHSLKQLSIRKYPGKDLRDLAGLIALESLDLLEGKFVSSVGLGSLTRLKFLRFGFCRQLRRLDDLEHLQALEQLKIVKCRAIADFGPISALGGLKLLVLEDVGRIASLDWLAGLTALETLLLTGDTNIVDGDLEPVAALPRLEQVAYASRRHYSHQADHWRVARVKTDA